jgi:thiamine monophosphate kinase
MHLTTNPGAGLLDLYRRHRDDLCVTSHIGSSALGYCLFHTGQLHLSQLVPAADNQV